MATAEAANHSVSALFAEADKISLDPENNALLLEGHARITFHETTVAADSIRVDRDSERIEANGSVVVWQGGDIVIEIEQYTSATDFTLAEAVNLKMRINNHVHIFAKVWRIDENNDDHLDKVIYTACSFCDDRNPTWKLRVNEVHWDKKARRINMYHSIFDLGSVPILYIPYLSIPEPSVQRASGLLVPKFKFQDNIGLTVSLPVYFVLGETRDMTLTPLVSFTSLPGLDVEYREVFKNAKWTARINFQPSDTHKSAKNKYGLSVTSRYQHSLPERFKLNIENSYSLENYYHPRFSLYKISHPLYTNKISVTRLDSTTWLDVYLDRYDHFDRHGSERLYGYSLPSARVEGWFAFPYPWGQIRYELDVSNRFLQENDRQFRLIGELGYTRDVDLRFGMQWRQTIDVRVDVYENKRIESVLDQKIAWRVYPQMSGEVRYPLLIPPSQSTSDQGVSGASHVIEPFVSLAYTPVISSTSAIYQMGIHNQDTLGINRFIAGHGAHNRANGYDLVERGLRVDYGIRYDGWAGDYTWSFGVDQSYRPFGDEALKMATGIEQGFARLGLSGKLSISFFRSEFFLGLSVDGDQPIPNSVEFAHVYMGFIFPTISFNTRYSFHEGGLILGQGEQNTLQSGLSFVIADNWSMTTSTTWDLLRKYPLTRGGISLSYNDDCFALKIGAYQGFDEYGAATDNFGASVSFSIAVAPSTSIGL